MRIDSGQVSADIPPSPAFVCFLSSVPLAPYSYANHTVGMYASIM